MAELRTHEVVVHGPNRMRLLLSILLYNHRWFQVEPWPDDEFKVTVKEECREWLEQKVSLLNELGREEETDGDKEEQRAIH